MTSSKISDSRGGDDAPSARSECMGAIDRFKVAGVPVSLLNMKMACDEVERRLRMGEGGYCIFRDMNGIVCANDDPALLRAHQNAVQIGRAHV